MSSCDEALKEGRRGGRTHAGLAVMGAASVLLAVLVVGFAAVWSVAKRPDDVGLQPSQPTMPAAGSADVRAVTLAATASPAPSEHTSAPTAAPVEAAAAPKATLAPLSELATLVRAQRRVVKRAPRLAHALAVVNATPAPAVMAPAPAVNAPPPAPVVAALAPAETTDDNEDHKDDNSGGGGSGGNSGSSKDADSGDDSDSRGKGK